MGLCANMDKNIIFQPYFLPRGQCQWLTQTMNMRLEFPSGVGQPEKKGVKNVLFLHAHVMELILSDN